MGLAKTVVCAAALELMLNALLLEYTHFAQLIGRCIIDCGTRVYLQMVSSVLLAQRVRAQFCSLSVSNKLQASGILPPSSFI